MNTCPHPESLAPGRTMCFRCCEKLRKVIAAAISLLTDLRVTARRADHTGAGGKIGSRQSKTTVPLPYRPDAAELAHELEDVLTRAHLRTPEEWGADEEGPALLARLEALTTQALPIVDLPEESFFIGICGTDGCQQELQVKKGQTSVVCECGAYHHVQSRLDRRVKAARRAYASAPMISKALGIPVHSIHNWSKRGLLTETQEADGRRPLFSVGEVYAVAERMSRHSPR